jgi:hypothetical protein
MTRTRHTEEQIIAVLKDPQAGVSVQDLWRKHGISDATFYKWKFSMSYVQDYRRTSRRMLKKARLLTRPTLAVISPPALSLPRQTLRPGTRLVPSKVPANYHLLRGLG